MESLPVILIITNKQCGHCNTMRGLGPLKSNSQENPSISGKYNWNVSFFKLLLTGNVADNIQKFRIYEIVMQKMAPDLSFNEIDELNEFRLIGGKIIRFSLKNLGGKLNFTKDIDSTVNVSVTNQEFSDVYNKKTIFQDILKEKIPQKIIPNLLLYYPCFMFFNAEIWNSKPNNIIGYVPGVELIDNDGNISVDSSKGVNMKPGENPVSNAERFHKLGKDYQLLSKYPEKKEEPIKQIVKKNEIECIKPRYRIIGK